ncbi:bifunctional nuclease family protein [bacterium]|nr:bifunctional nuclease family protein [candidate division CSSED10-310 bacterium]
MLIKMSVKNLTLDPLTNMPIIILKNEEGNLVVPIWVGVFEANAIALELEKIPTPRPMTHDLMKKIMKKLGVIVSRALITDLKDGTYFAVLEFKTKIKTFTIDARPSDAIALALRFDAPIYVEQEVVEKSKAADHGKDQEDAEKLKDWLKSLKPEDFGKYSM